MRPRLSACVFATSLLLALLDTAVGLGRVGSGSETLSVANASITRTTSPASITRQIAIAKVCIADVGGAKVNYTSPSHALGSQGDLQIQFPISASATLGAENGGGLLLAFDASASAAQKQAVVIAGAQARGAKGFASPVPVANVIELWLRSPVPTPGERIVVSTCLGKNRAVATPTATTKPTPKALLFTNSYATTLRTSWSGSAASAGGSVTESVTSISPTNGSASAGWGQITVSGNVNGIVEGTRLEGTFTAVLVPVGLTKESVTQTITFSGGSPDTSKFDQTVPLGSITSSGAASSGLNFSGNGEKTIAPFTTTVGETLTWMWQNTNGSSPTGMTIDDLSQNSFVANSDGSVTRGSTYLPPGKHTLHVITVGNWTIHIG
jgi:hypothetical protein